MSNMLVFLCMLCDYIFEIWVSKVNDDEDDDEVPRQAGSVVRVSSENLSVDF